RRRERGLFAAGVKENGCPVQAWLGRGLSLPTLPSTLSKSGHSGSELVPQCELHDAWLRQQARVGSEIRRLLRQRRQQRRRSHRLSIEAREVRHVKNIPPELHAVCFPIGHLPVLIETHIPVGVTVPTQHVARADPAGEGLSKVRLRRGGIRKKVNSSF